VKLKTGANQRRMASQDDIDGGQRRLRTGDEGGSQYSVSSSDIEI